MLIIKRKAHDIITIAPLEGLDTSRPIAELFDGGVIEIKLLEVGRKQVKVAIDAPPKLQIWRGRKDSKLSSATERSESSDENAADAG